MPNGLLPHKKSLEYFSQSEGVNNPVQIAFTKSALDLPSTKQYALIANNSYTPRYGGQVTIYSLNDEILGPRGVNLDAAVNLGKNIKATDITILQNNGGFNYPVFISQSGDSTRLRLANFNTFNKLEFDILSTSYRTLPPGIIEDSSIEKKLTVLNKSSGILKFNHLIVVNKNNNNIATFRINTDTSGTLLGLDSYKNIVIPAADGIPIEIAEEGNGYFYLLTTKGTFFYQAIEDDTGKLSFQLWAFNFKSCDNLCHIIKLEDPASNARGFFAVSNTSSNSINGYTISDKIHQNFNIKFDNVSSVAYDKINHILTAISNDGYIEQYKLGIIFKDDLVNLIIKENLASYAYPGGGNLIKFN